MRHPLRLFCLIALAAWVAAIATGVDALASPLIGGFESYASAAHVKEGALARLPWRVEEESSLPPGDRRPAVNFLRLSVPTFTHVGHTGELYLTFFNDRLMTTVFYPVDPAGYLKALRQAGILGGDSDEEAVAPYTRIWTATDYQGRVYVAWVDVRLEREQRQWISRYS